MPFNPLKFLQSTISPGYLGLDIGTTSMKVVEVQKGDNRSRVANYGILESEGALAREHTALQTSSSKLFERQAAQFLETLLKEVRPETDRVVASVPTFAAFTTVLTLPEMSAKELEQAITFQARRLVPLPIEEVALDWIEIDRATDEKGFSYIRVLLISVPREYIQKYQNLCAGAGLSLQSLEIEAMSLTRMVTAGDQTPTLIVDIGSRSTQVLVAQGGVLQFVGQTDYAGHSLTQAVSSSLNINPLRAEELKKERGIIGTGPNYELSTIMVPFVDAIIGEVQRVLHAYVGQFPNSPQLERAVLTGGGANLLGLRDRFEKRLSIPTVISSPFAQFEYPTEISPLIPELNTRLSVALGLTKRQLG